MAVGECGLDFNRNFSPRPVQEAVFRAHIELALELGLPLFCHEREASSTFLAIIDEFPALDPARVCVHCFTGAENELKEYVKRGYQAQPLRPRSSDSPTLNSEAFGCRG